MNNKLIRNRKSLEKTIKIIDVYKTYKIRLVARRSLSSSKVETYNDYVRKVDVAISKMKDSYRLVFCKTFIEDAKLDILEFYSVSQFYRLRNASSNAFLFNFKNL